MTSLLVLISLLADIHGTVFDPSGRPVPDAQMTCGSAASSTDQTGSFTLDADQACTAAVIREGFARRFVVVTPGDENRVVLALDPLSERVVVTASGSPVALEEAGVAATVFTEEDLKLRQYAPVADILRDVPGVNVVQTGNGGGQTSLFSRGSESNGALILLDGVPLSDPGGTFDFAGLTSQGLERIEVVRGPESALFGAEAANGVLQLFTKRGDPEARIPHGTLIYDRGSFSTDHWTAAIDGGLLNRFDYALSADQYRTTGPFLNDAFRNTTGTANIGFRISDTTNMRAIYRTYDSYSGTPGQNAYGLDNRLANYLARDNALTLRLDDARSSRFNQRVYFTFHRNRRRSVDTTEDMLTSTALLKTEPGTDNTYFVRLVPASAAPDPGTFPATGFYFPFPFDGVSTTDRTGANYQGNLEHRGGGFTFGYEFDRQAGMITGDSVNRRNHGISIYDQWSLGNRIFLSGGVRIEHSSVFGARYAPRGAITFRLPTDTYLRLSVARGIKEPTLIESFARDPFFVGNPNLRPEKTDSFEAGLSRDWFHRRVHSEISYFRNRFDDLIQFIFVSNPGTWENIARSYARGFEASGSVNVAPSTTVRAGYTRLYTRILAGNDAGLELLRRPRNSGNLSLQWTPKRWTVAVGARFVGDRRDSDFFVFFPEVNRNAAYRTVYLNASWQATKNLAPFFRINNLTNETYQEAAGYAAWDRNASGGLRLTW